MTQSNSETTQSSSPNGSDSSSRGLLSALLHWIKSYGGLSDLKKNNKALRQQNEKLAELESKLDTVLQSSDSNLTPTTSTETN
jgi:hypothetical protein